MGTFLLVLLVDILAMRCAQVRSIVCAKKSSDWGAKLPIKNYWPLASLATGAGGGNDDLNAIIGKGSTLVLLQEVRAHRMSHFQLLKFEGLE